MGASPFEAPLRDGGRHFDGAGEHRARRRQTVPASGRYSRPRRSQWVGRVADGLSLAVVTVLSGLMLWQSGRLLLADLRVAEARSVIDFSEAATVSPRLWDSIRRAYGSALRATPESPDLHEALGQIERMTARRQQPGSAGSRLHYQRAAEHLQTALALRPQDGLAWAALAESLQAVEPGSPTAWQAWRNALRYAPLEYAVPTTLLHAAFIGWNAAPEDVKEWVRDAYELELLVPRRLINELAGRYSVRDWDNEVEKLRENERKWRAAAKAAAEEQARAAGAGKAAELSDETKSAPQPADPAPPAGQTGRVEEAR